MERAGEVQAQATRLSGAETARGLEYSKTGTLLGMSQQKLGAANQAIAEAKAQQMSAIGDLASAGMQMASAGAGATSPDPQKYTQQPQSMDLQPLQKLDVGTGGETPEQRMARQQRQIDNLLKNEY